MGQDESNKNKNKNKIKENELLCNKCCEYPLFELLANENNINKIGKYKNTNRKIKNNRFL